MQEPGAMSVPSPGVGAQYAGFGARFVGLLIDGVILMVVNFIINAVIQSTSLGTALSLIIQLAYFVYFFTSTGQTLGAKVMGIKVVDGNGQLLSIGSAVVRVIGSWVSSIILGIGYLMMLWDSKKQTLHDKFAGSYVVKI
jgi:uncharacterized RDD family membrane protein YckC